MQAKIVYGIKHVSYGDGHDDNGWYMMRFTICNGAIIDRKQIARFNCDTFLENGMNARDFSDYCKAGHLVAHKDLMGIDAYLKL